MVADASQPDELPEVDVLVLASPDYLSDLGPEPPPVLLLTDDPQGAAGLVDLPVWGALPMDSGPEELAAAVRALGEGLWAGSPVLLQSLLGRPAFSPALDGMDPVADP